MSGPVKDFLGNPLVEGCTVVYPATSGRSCQMVEATLLSIEVRSQEEHEALAERYTEEWADNYRPAGEPTKAKLMPTGRGSRWKQHWDGSKAVTLTANAPSIVRVDYADGEMS